MGSGLGGGGGAASAVSISTGSRVASSREHVVALGERHARHVESAHGTRCVHAKPRDGARLVEDVRASQDHGELVLFEIFHANGALVHVARESTTGRRRRSIEVSVCPEKLKPTRAPDDAPRKRPKCRSRGAASGFGGLVVRSRRRRIEPARQPKDLRAMRRRILVRPHRRRRRMLPSIELARDGQLSPESRIELWRRASRRPRVSRRRRSRARAILALRIAQRSNVLTHLLIRYREPRRRAGFDRRLLVVRGRPRVVGGGASPARSSRAAPSAPTPSAKEDDEQDDRAREYPKRGPRVGGLVRRTSGRRGSVVSGRVGGGGWSLRRRERSARVTRARRRDERARDAIDSHRDLFVRVRRGVHRARRRVVAVSVDGREGTRDETALARDDAKTSVQHETF